MHAHTHSEKKTATEENGEPQMSNSVDPSERPPEISNPRSLPVQFNGHIWPFVLQCLQKEKHVSVKLTVYSTLLTRNPNFPSASQHSSSSFQNLYSLIRGMFHSKDSHWSQSKWRSKISVSSSLCVYLSLVQMILGLAQKYILSVPTFK